MIEIFGLWGFGGDGAAVRRRAARYGAIELAESPKGGLAKKAIGKLLTDGLVEEVPAGGMLSVWRRDDDRGPLALCITPRGLAAIGVEKAIALPEAPLQRAVEGSPNAL